MKNIHKFLNPAVAAVIVLFTATNISAMITPAEKEAMFQKMLANMSPEDRAKTIAERDAQKAYDAAQAMERATMQKLPKEVEELKAQVKMLTEKINNIKNDCFK